MAETQEDEKPKLTPEQVAQRKKDLSKFYNDQIEFLKTQLKYENLVTEIEESRMRRAMAIARQAQIYGQPPDETEGKEEVKAEGVVEEPVAKTEEKVERKLKVTTPA